MAADRPRPISDEASEAYWAGAARGALVLPRCESCTLLHFPPLLHCPHCGHEGLVHEDVAGAGALYSYTTLNTPPGPGFAELVPLLVGVVELDAQPMLLIAVNLRGDGPVSPRIGARIELVFDEIIDGVMAPQFELVVA